MELLRGVIELMYVKRSERCLPPRVLIYVSGKRKWKAFLWAFVTTCQHFHHPQGRRVSFSCSSHIFTFFPNKNGDIIIIYSTTKTCSVPLSVPPDPLCCHSSFQPPFRGWYHPPCLIWNVLGLPSLLVCPTLLSLPVSFFSLKHLKLSPFLKIKMASKRTFSLFQATDSSFFPLSSNSL